MARYKSTKTSKKKPDEFITLMDQIVRYILDRRGLFIGLAVILLGLLGAYGFYQYWQGKQAEQWTARIEAALNQSGKTALKTWEELLSENPPLSLTSLIVFKQGSLYAKEENWPKAAQAFKKGQADAPEYLVELMQYAELVALENAAKNEEALKLAQSMSENLEHPYREEALLTQFRIQIATGKAAEAKNGLLNLSQDPEVSPPVKQEALNMLLLMENNP